MAMIRCPQVETYTTADGTSTGTLKVANTVGIPRHSLLNVSWAAGGEELEVVLVVDSTTLLCRKQVKVHKNDLSNIPNGSIVIMETQWVPDLYSDDIPQSLAIPVK